MDKTTLRATLPLSAKRIASAEFAASPQALTLVSLQSHHGKAAALAGAVRQQCGVDLPGPGRWVGGRWVGGQAVTVSWGGHEQWFISTQTDEPYPFTQRMSEALGHCAAITDQSDAWARIKLRGPACYTVLERLCPLDLHPSVFPPGHVARTVMAHLGVQIMAISGEPEFVFLTPSSSAQSFWTTLEQAAASGF